MTIAIYRHMKLLFSVAKPNLTTTGRESNISAFHHRVPDDFGVGVLPKPVEIQFANKRKRDDITMEEVWRFHRGKVTLVKYHRAGMQRELVSTEDIPPLLNMVWTDNNTANEALESMETRTTRAIIESHIHSYEIDPTSHAIYSFDFNPNRDLTKPYADILPVRSKHELEVALLTDSGESPDEWLKLLMGE